jgi:hypothetical protein
MVTEFGKTFWGWRLHQVLEQKASQCFENHLYSHQ